MSLSMYFYVYLCIRYSILCGRSWYIGNTIQDNRMLWSTQESLGSSHRDVNKTKTCWSCRCRRSIVSLSLCVSVCLSVCLCVCLSVCVCFSISLSVCLCLAVCDRHVLLSFSHPLSTLFSHNTWHVLCLCVSLYVSVSVCLYVCLSVCLCVCLCVGKLYAVGGHDGSEHLKSGEVFDPITNTWQSIAPMSKLRYI